MRFETFLRLFHFLVLQDFLLELQRLQIKKDVVCAAVSEFARFISRYVQIFE